MKSINFVNWHVDPHFHAKGRLGRLPAILVDTNQSLGIGLDEMVVWDFTQPLGGATVEQLKRAKLILWKGFCSVHQMFKPQHITDYRARVPGGRVISHPENSFEVCQQSDDVGSTEFILRTVRASAPGSQWLVGTELNLVKRLADEMRPNGVEVEFMSPTVCMCSTMFRTDPQHLAWVLDNLVAGKVVNRIRVPDAVAAPARTALDLMLEVVD